MVAFYCYDDGKGTPDSDGKRPNLWDRWYAEQNSKVKARHDTVLRMLKSVTIWRDPFFHGLGGKGIEQILIHKDRQWRILGYRDAAMTEFTVVGICYHKDRNYTPRDAEKTANRIMSEILLGTSERLSCVPPE